MARLDSLTSLRWFAALAVFARHSIRHDGVMARLVPQGATAVSFFFILSGFVLAWSYRSGDGAGGFYRRRLARIYPAYLVAVGVGLVVADTITGWWPTPSALAAVISLVQAWSTDATVHYAVSPPLWSLSCEAFFYLLFPLLIGPLLRLHTRPRAVLLGLLVVVTWVVAVLSGSTEETGVGFWVIYIFPVTRLAEFLIGILIALAVRDGYRSPVPLRAALLLVASAYLLAGWVPLHLMWVATTVVPFALLVATAATADLQGAASWLRASPLVRLGTWSYAFYLIHGSVLRLRGEYFRGHSVGVNAAVALVATLAAAALIHHLIEGPLEARLRGSRAAIRPTVVD
ncbi:MAG: acyltransferase [Acidimicrobiales bacterium]